MNKVIAVQALDNYALAITFDSGEKRLFDMTPYLEKGIFKMLKDTQLFKQAYIAWDTVCWPNELDISPDTLYLRSTAMESYTTRSSNPAKQSSLTP